MEPKKSNEIVTYDNNINNNDVIVSNNKKMMMMMMKIKDEKETPPPKPMKKRRRAMNFFRAALYMLRRKSKKSSMHVDLASKVLVSMRPLNNNVQTIDNKNYNNNNQPRIEPPASQLAPPLIEKTTVIEEVFTPPVSPTVAKSIASSSSMDSLSQYASALNLRDLDTCEEDEVEDEEGDDNGGDEMIDAKAEEFINQFYEQMKIQNSEYVNSENARKLKGTAI